MRIGGRDEAGGTGGLASGMGVLRYFAISGAHLAGTL
jgi:hypothetical protein